MDEQKALLKAAFGDSSDGEDFNDGLEGWPHHQITDPTVGDQSPRWERVKEINGLWLCRNFLSPQHQSSFLSALLNEGWFVEESHNQAMRFGDLPDWATELSDSIREAVNSNEGGGACALPSDLLWREPLFDQMIVNVYQPGEGICPHVDLMRFEDGIAIISLDSSCVMHFSKVEREDGSTSAKIPVYLNPGSLILMSGEARYLWKHEINRKPGLQVWEGKELEQKRRISITLRKLCHMENTDA